MGNGLTCGCSQILSITCDNASPNDTMVIELARILKAFPGATNRTRCFAHILNLVARSIIRQFDVPKSKDDGALDDELAGLAADLELDEEEGSDEADDEAEEVEDDNLEGWVDERAGMSKSDRDALDISVRPVKLVLVKVCKERFTSESSHLICIVTQTGKCHKKLHDYYSPCLVFNPREPGVEEPNDAPGCNHSVELNLRYGCLCN